MAIQKKILKYFIAFIEKECWIALVAPSLIGIRYNMNPVPGTLNFHFPAITDRDEEINRYMGSVNLIPIDILEHTFEVEDWISFDPSKLDYDNPYKDKKWERLYWKFLNMLYISQMPTSLRMLTASWPRSLLIKMWNGCGMESVYLKKKIKMYYWLFLLLQLVENMLLEEI